MADPLILVTGATGTVGREVVKQLIESGQKTRALAHDPAKAAQFGGAVEVVTADLLRPKTLAPVFEGVEKVFVLSPPTPDLETIEGNAFEAAKRAGVKHIVNLSNYGAGSFGTSIWEWHGASEKNLLTLGVPWTILRPARFMTDTPFPWNWISIKEQGVLFESSGDGKVTMIDPRDIAAVAVKALTTPGHEGKVYELTSSEALNGAEIARKIAAAIGKPVKLIDAPAEAAREAMLKSGVPSFMADAILRYYETLKEGRWHLTSTAAQLLGRPTRSYEEWLKDNVAALA